MFVDKVIIQVTAGAGGNGKLSFHHTKNHRGGPDGGDGGRGGDIVLRADHNTSSLLKYRSNKVWQADNGANGENGRKRGKSADTLELIVPPGTQILEDGEVVADLTDNDATFVVATGGDGGFGNAHFTSSTRQAPRFAEIGEPGEERELTLELKLIAQVGLIGLPNAGKSTLLGSISNARPEIADYAFTTLVPNLGMVDIDGASVLFADIPGLIEGASQGRGLGDEFLRHVERTSVLIHLIDATAEEIAADYAVIQQELRNYTIDLSSKPQLVALNKCDALDEPARAAAVAKMTALGLKLDKDLFVISAASKLGVTELLRATLMMFQAQPAEPVAEAAIPVLGLREHDHSWRIEDDDHGVFVIHGAEIEKLARRTDQTQTEAVDRLMKILTSRGVIREIERRSTSSDAIIQIGRKKFRW